ncbi:MAG: leucyl/phenylalanyl-tRNA--protein transferase [Chthonomonadales bacterium]
MALEINLTPRGLLTAYSNGIFPMWMEDENEVWWFRPNPRAILPLDGFHLSHSLAKRIRQGEFEVTYDRAFEQVMRACAVRPGQGCWISEEFVAVYSQLHKKGFAHSVEVWQKGELVGGTYGVSIGGAFMAESKFHTATDMSKVALYHLVQRLNERGFHLLDVQYLTPHLATLGVIEIPDYEYADRLLEAIDIDVQFDELTQIGSEP